MHIAFISCLLASPLLIHESYTHGSHSDRSSCFLSFSAAPIEIIYIDHFRFLLSCLFNLTTPYRYIYHSNIAVNCYTVAFIFPSPATGKPDTNLVGRALRARADHNTTTKLREVLETLPYPDASRKYKWPVCNSTVRINLQNPPLEAPPISKMRYRGSDEDATISTSPKCGATRMALLWCTKQ